MENLARHWRSIGIAGGCWLTVAAIMGAITALSGAATTTPDERVTAGLLVARDAMTVYRKEHGDYDEVTAAKLRKIDPEVPADLQDPVVFEDIYALSVSMPSGVLYRLALGAGGRETRECTVPVGVAAGECNMGESNGATGTW